MILPKKYLIGWLLCLVGFSLWGQVTDSTVLSGSEVYDLYGRLIDRNVLGPGMWKGRPPTITVTNLPADSNAAIALIEAEITKAGFEIVPDGSKFVRIHSPKWRGTEMERYFEKLKRPKDSNAKEGFLRGAINMVIIDLNWVLLTYSQLRGRTVFRSGEVNTSMFHFRNATPLTEEEVRFAYEGLLAMNGVALVDDGEKFVWAVTLEEVNRIKPSSVELDKASKLIDLERIPAFEGYPPKIPTNEPVAQMVKRVATDLYKKMTTKGPPRLPATVDAVIAFYGKVTNKNVAPSKHGNYPLFFRARTSLTKAELAYALKSMLELNHFEIVAVGDDTITVMPSIEAKVFRAKASTNSVAPTKMPRP